MICPAISVRKPNLIFGTATSDSTAVGFSNNGALTVTNGATFDSGQVLIGPMPGATGTATASGAGTVWTAEGVSVGFSGTGPFNVLNGAAVNAGLYDFSLADALGSIGTAAVDGPGSTVTASSVAVGNGGAGTLMISNGGTVIGNKWSNYIGHGPGAVGFVTVTGTGSRLILDNNDLMIGQGGTGTLTIADGGFVSVSGGLKLGLLANSAGTINIGGAAGMAAAAAGTLDSATL